MYNRITLFGAMPPLKVSLADRFIDERKGNIVYSIPLFIKKSGPRRKVGMHEESSGLETLPRFFTFVIVESENMLHSAIGPHITPL